MARYQSRIAPSKVETHQSFSQHQRRVYFLGNAKLPFSAPLKEVASKASQKGSIIGVSHPQ